MFDFLPSIAPFQWSDFAVAVIVSFCLGLVCGRYRGRAARWLSWRIYHAGVHLPRFGRR
jgi:hypothetical protein